MTAFRETIQTALLLGNPSFPGSNRLSAGSRLILLLGLVIGLSSCSTLTPKANYSALAKAAIRLNLDIDQKDNHKLYLEAAQWMGVPYRSGGMSKSGTDCSGLTLQLYKRVYRKSLVHHSQGQLSEARHRVSRNKLQEGDLVFFGNGRSKKRVTHVGVYLKKGKFIHASSSHGVMVSSLNEAYYKKCWITGGRY